MQKQQSNQNWVDKIRLTQNLKHLAFLGLGLLSWLGFSYLFVLYIKLGLTRSIYNIPWSSDAPNWMFLKCLIGAAVMIFARWKFDLLTERSNSLLRDFLILILLIPINSLLTSSFFILFLGLVYAGGDAPKEYEFLMAFLSGIIIQTFVAMTCIGYFYLTLVTQTKDKLLQAQKARSEMELKNLQQSIEPHFLFNNLNVLSSLIEKNPQIANEFLDKMAQLYRYILQTKDAEVVSIKDEIAFTQNYLYLLKKRFGKAYNFDWQIEDSQLNGQLIVPTALQSLLENVVKHNAGSRSEPLQICVKLDEENLIVENGIRPKTTQNLQSGTGLQNLQARYNLLTEKEIQVRETESGFMVKIPLLKVTK